jgi:hypothetical protein
LAFERGQPVGEETPVTGHLGAGDGGVDRPERVLVGPVGGVLVQFLGGRLGARPRAGEPVVEVVVEVSAVAEPTALVKVMPGRGVDSPVRRRVADRPEEFRDDPAVGRPRVFERLLEGPPPVVVRLLDLGVGQVDERDVRLVPVRLGDVSQQRAVIEKLCPRPGGRIERSGGQHQRHGHLHETDHDCTLLRRERANTNIDIDKRQGVSH